MYHSVMVRVMMISYNYENHLSSSVTSSHIILPSHSLVTAKEF